MAERVGTAAGGSPPSHAEADWQGMRGATTVRDLWAQLKESVSAALDRVSPGMLIAAGLAAVVLAFGALGLSMLADGGSGLEDLGLGAPPGRGEEGDPASGTGDAEVGGLGGDSLSEGLTTRGPGASGGSGGRDDGPAGADGTGENAMAAPGSPSPRRGCGVADDGASDDAPRHDVPIGAADHGARDDGHHRGPAVHADHERAAPRARPDRRAARRARSRLNRPGSPLSRPPLSRPPRPRRPPARPARRRGRCARRRRSRSPRSPAARACAGSCGPR